MLRYCLLVATLLIGCAAELESPDRFQGGVGGGADAGVDQPQACDPGIDVPVDILAAKCAGSVCHDADAPSAGLDLGSPDVATRLVDVASGCNARPLIDSADPAASYLLNKLGDAPECGSKMPLGGSLTEGEFACVEEWVGSL